MEHPMDEEVLQPADLSAGYHVTLYVNADGTFRVMGPEPHEPEARVSESETMPGEPSMMEAGDPSDVGEPLPNIGAALKAVLQIVKDNPIGQSAQQSFDAGYASGPKYM